MHLGKGVGTGQAMHRTGQAMHGCRDREGYARGASGGAPPLHLQGPVGYHCGCTPDSTQLMHGSTADHRYRMRSRACSIHSARNPILQYAVLYHHLPNSVVTIIGSGNRHPVTSTIRREFGVVGFMICDKVWTGIGQSISVRVRVRKLHQLEG